MNAILLHENDVQNHTSLGFLIVVKGLREEKEGNDNHQPFAQAL